MRTLVRIGLTLAFIGPLAPFAVSSASFAVAQQVQPKVERHSPESTMKEPPARKLAPASHSAFVLFEFNVKKKEGFKDFAAKVRDSAKSFKGEFLMREKVDSLFGGTPSTLSIISFPSVEDAKSWLASPSLDKLKSEREELAEVHTYLVEKLE